MVLRRIGILSCGKLMGTMYAFMGLVFGAIVTLLSLLGAMTMQNAGRNDAFASALFGVGSVIILPIFYGVMGFVGGIIMAAVYNFIAGIIGGIELELEAPQQSY